MYDYQPFRYTIVTESLTKSESTTCSSLQKLEIVENKKENATLEKSASFFFEKNELSPFPTDLYCMKNKYSRSFNRKFKSDYSMKSFPTANSIDNLSEYQETLNDQNIKNSCNRITRCSSPKDWYCANNLIELSNKYIEQFQETKELGDAQLKSTRELKNYFLIKAYLKSLDESYEIFLNVDRNPTNYSMPDLNWSKKITNKAIEVVRNNLKKYNNAQVWN